MRLSEELLRNLPHRSTSFQPIFLIAQEIGNWGRTQFLISNASTIGEIGRGDSGTNSVGNKIKMTVIRVSKRICVCVINACCMQG